MLKLNYVLLHTCDVDHRVTENSVPIPLHKIAHYNEKIKSPRATRGFKSGNKLRLGEGRTNKHKRRRSSDDSGRWPAARNSPPSSAQTQISRRNSKGRERFPGTLVCALAYPESEAAVSACYDL